jgi:hypothetical protein
MAALAFHRPTMFRCVAACALDAAAVSFWWRHRWPGDWAFLTQPMMHAVTARPGLESQELFVSKPFALLPQSFGGQAPGGG